MTLQEFISKYRGVENVGNTAQNKGECVGLVMVYISEVLKLSHIWGHAKDIFDNASFLEWKKIKNAANLYPKAGDIICWDNTKGGGYGHIAIVTESSSELDTFRVFEQNNPLGNPPKQTTYKTWSGVIGWLEVREGATDDIDELKEQVKELSDKVQEQNGEIDGLRQSRDAWRTKCKEYEETIEECYKILEQRQELVVKLQTELANKFNGFRKFSLLDKDIWFAISAKGELPTGGDIK